MTTVSLALLPGERLNPDRSSLRRREVFGGIPLPHRHLEQAIASRDDDDATWGGISIRTLESRGAAFAADHLGRRACHQSRGGRREQVTSVKRRGDFFSTDALVVHLKDSGSTQPFG